MSLFGNRENSLAKTLLQRVVDKDIVQKTTGWGSGSARELVKERYNCPHLFLSFIACRIRTSPSPSLRKNLPILPHKNECSVPNDNVIKLSDDRRILRHGPAFHLYFQRTVFFLEKADEAAVWGWRENSGILELIAFKNSQSEGSDRGNIFPLSRRCRCRQRRVHVHVEEGIRCQ